LWSISQIIHWAREGGGEIVVDLSAPAQRAFLRLEFLGICFALVVGLLLKSASGRLVCPGWPFKGATTPKYGDLRSIVLDRRSSQTCPFERVADCGIISPRRSSSAHLRQPWRAI
jgi:hypothetical protein